MAKRTDIDKVLIIGSGPIIIGQACEFDYSGTQACKALRKLGYKIVLVNSNPATIMTDPEVADVTYIEPLNVDRLERIIAKERPDALLPNLGGQSGLNLCAELNKAGVLDKYNVKVIGVQVDAIERGEDRIEFKNTMNELGIEMARSEVAYSVDEALAIADKLGYPVVLRPAYTMGGAGGGLVYNKEELSTVCARGLQASLVGQVLVEESVLGWEELELEVVRDCEGNMITVCYIENIDPVTLKPVPDGEPGEIVITTLVKEGAPLIRYRTHDLSRIVPGECPCGSKHPRLDVITGRTDDMVKIKGVNVFPAQIEEVIADTEGASSEYQIRISHLDGKDTMRIYVEATSGMVDFQALGQELAQKVKAKIGFTPIVKVVELGMLPRSEKKSKRVIDERYD